MGRPMLTDDGWSVGILRSWLLGLFRFVFLLLMMTILGEEQRHTGRGLCRLVL